MLTKSRNPDVEKVDLATRFRYFVVMGLLFYDRFQHVLMDRQVLRFSHLSSGWFNEDLCYFRTQVLIGSRNMDLDGDILEDHSIRVPGKEQAHPDSRFFRFWPDSPAGYFGHKFDEQHAKLEFIRMFEPFCNWCHFENVADEDIEKTQPTFYFPADPQIGATNQNRDVEDIVRLRGLVEMFDLEQQQWRWFEPITSASPVVCGLPLELANHQFDTVEMALTRYMGMRGSVYVGMPALGPLDLRASDRKKFGPRIPTVPMGHPFRHWAEQKIPFTALETLMNSPEFTEEIAIQNEVFHLPIPETKHAQKRNDYLSRVLNGPAKRALDQLVHLGSNAFKPKIVVPAR